MPVHLGSMPMAVAAALRQIELMPGDVVALNDPFAGGTHLPDVTLVMAVGSWQLAVGSTTQRYEVSAQSRSDHERERRSNKTELPTGHRPPPTLFYVANRAHHADIGGGNPGSMGMATDIYGEGLRIPPVRIVRGGVVDDDMMRLLLANVRGITERRADFEAQIGSLHTGANRLHEIVARRGAREARQYAAHLIAYSARLMRRTISEIPDGEYRATDWLDDDGVTSDEVVIRVCLTISKDRARVDFTGSSKQVAGPINAVEAITVSAVSYVFRCLIGGDVPASAGLMEPIKVIAPAGTIVNAEHPAPVAGGNVETSQRIVDVLLKALHQALPERIPAASQGTMNNLTIGGVDPRSGQEFSYYETVAGGMGARPHSDGMSAVHTHMTNSLNTPVGSGGRGKQKGGDGVVREIETLVPSRMSLLADRRKLSPYGLDGGEDGKRGCDQVIVAGRKRPIGSKGSWQLDAGDRVLIETPGGGGFGRRKQ